MKLGILTGKDLDFSSGWIILDSKFSVSVSMDLVAYVATNKMGSIIPNNLG